MVAGLARSETFARASITKDDFSSAALLRALEVADIPWNTTRKNVFPEGETGVRGMLLGFFVFGGNSGCSSQTSEHSWLTKLLVGHAKRARPDFIFTSIQVNKNYASRPHVDKNNLGKSLILGLGDYRDGQLWVHDDEGKETLELKESITSAYNYTAGKQISGSILDCHDELVEFDGTKLHYTLPFVGDRYTLIYFTCDRFLEACEETQVALTKAGFDFSWSCCQLQKELQERREEKRELKKELHAKKLTEWREEQRKEREKLGRCFARTWNKGWGGACPHWRAPENEIFCRMHEDERETWKTHGRIDGVIPAAKKEEMLKWQKIMVAKGEKPPSPLPYGSCVLVPFPQWSLETIVPGLQGYLPPTVVNADDEAGEDHEDTSPKPAVESVEPKSVICEEQPRKRKLSILMSDPDIDSIAGAGKQQLMTAFFPRTSQSSGDRRVVSRSRAKKQQLMTSFLSQLKEGKAGTIETLTH